MVQATIPPNTELYQDENDPAPGEIKIVKGSLIVLDNCDSLTQWSVESGVGVTIELDTSNPAEGTGCVKVNIPVGITAIVKAVKISSSWDISVHKYLKVYLKSEITGGGTYLYFGESVYNEQSTGPFDTISWAWGQKIWDISGISVASRDAVTIFAVRKPASVENPQVLWIDYVFADPGPSEIKANDGDRIIRAYPKVYSGSYPGNGTSQTITLPRKGTLSRIQVDRMTVPSVLWITGMVAGHSKRMANDGSAIADITDGITNVGDCYFSVGNNNSVNANGYTHFYTVWWDD